MPAAGTKSVQSKLQACPFLLHDAPDIEPNQVAQFVHYILFSPCNPLLTVPSFPRSKPLHFTSISRSQSCHKNA
eukprot:41334-Pleurochrysis_carterae.AAC.2